MAPSFATLLALAATVASPALAELKQLTLTVPIAVQTDYEVSVISADSTSTAYAVKCATSQKCDLAPGATLKNGPSTVALAFAKTSNSKTTQYVIPCVQILMDTHHPSLSCYLRANGKPTMC